MTLNLGGWIHSFTVTETQTHKAGYTIYKITSIVFPRSVPQALTCLVVWKRFHDVKRLHRDLSRRHKSLKLPGKLPEPSDCSYFKRFEADVIQRRKVYILELLDFAAQHPALYKCNTFAQFFSDAHAQSPSASPLHNLYVERGNKLCKQKAIDLLAPQEEQDANGEGAIAEICDKLDLPYDAHNAGGIIPLDLSRDKADEIKNYTDTAKTEPQTETVEAASVNVECVTKSNKDYTRYLTPMASIESDDSDYIYEAALEFSHAVQAEVNLDYKVAHERYKRGVELLLNGSKDDHNDERKFIAKAKIAKYLARADEIHTRFLRAQYAARQSSFHLSIDVIDSQTNEQLYLECPWNQLAKYKVLRVLGNRVMQVQCITEPHQPTCIMKGVEKPPSSAPTQSLFLPQQVPYMVELLAYFQSDQKIFLLLRQAEGGLLYDYIQSYTATPADKCTSYAQLFPEMAHSPQQSEAVDEHAVEDTPTLAEHNDFNDLVRSSQQLLKSVSNTLRVVDETEQPQEQLKKSPRRHIPQTHIPEACLRQWACELAIAIHCLHGKGIILRDLNISNILLGIKGQLLLSYFYQHEGLTGDDDNYLPKALSLQALDGHFVAPERPLTPKSDWWSYGVVLYQLLVGLPFKMTHPGPIEIYGCVQYPDHLDISEAARDLLENLLQLRPESRPDYEQLQNHNFFQGINWQELLKNGLNKTAKSSKS